MGLGFRIMIGALFREYVRDPTVVGQPKRVYTQ